MSSPALSYRTRNRSESPYPSSSRRQHVTSTSSSSHPYRSSYRSHPHSHRHRKDHHRNRSSKGGSSLRTVSPIESHVVNEKELPPSPDVEPPVDTSTAVPLPSGMEEEGALPMPKKWNLNLWPKQFSTGWLLTTVIVAFTLGIAVGFGHSSKLYFLFDFIRSKFNANYARPSSNTSSNLSTPPQDQKALEHLATPAAESNSKIEEIIETPSMPPPEMESPSSDNMFVNMVNQRIEKTKTNPVTSEDPVTLYTILNDGDEEEGGNRDSDNNNSSSNNDNTVEATSAVEEEDDDEITFPNVK